MSARGDSRSTPRIAGPAPVTLVLESERCRGVRRIRSVVGQHLVHDSPGMQPGGIGTSPTPEVPKPGLPRQSSGPNPAQKPERRCDTREQTDPAESPCCCPQTYPPIVQRLDRHPEELVFGRVHALGLPRNLVQRFQLTDGGPSVTTELPSRVAGPPFGAAHSASFSIPQRSTI